MEVDGIVGPGEENDALLSQIERHAEPFLEPTFVVADLKHPDLVGATEEDGRDHFGKYGGGFVVLVVPADRIVDELPHLLGGHMLLGERRSQRRRGPGGQTRGEQ